MTIRAGFFGTPDPAVPALEQLVAADDIAVEVVVTNPDRPRGRSGTPRPPPVKQAATAHDLRVWQPRRPAEIADDLADLALDVCAVVAYGAILPPAVLGAATHGFVNLHFSLLPRWRGAAPVQHAIRAGDEVTGVATFVLDEGMDTGPLLRTREVDLPPDATSGELLDELARIGAPLLVESVRALVGGEQPRPQPDQGATYAPKITSEDVAIDWAATPREIVDLVRSANPAPGAHTQLLGKRLKVWGARHGSGEGPPGQVIDRAEDGPVVAVGGGAVVLTAVQPEGKPRMDGAAFVNGYQPVGQRLGS